MRTVLVLLLLTSVAFAGCTDDGGEDEGDLSMNGGGMEHEGHAQIELPTWQVGDWWTYENSFGSDYTLVVTEDNGATWTMDTDSANLAFFSDAFGEVSYLGDIRKSDLAGSQDGTPVKWLDFPLHNNKEWAAQWDGQTFDMVSHVGDGDVAHIVASIGGTAVNNMVYDASVGWFTSISFGDPVTGEEYGRMDLKDSGSGFTGELVRVTAVLASANEFDGRGATQAMIDSSTASEDSDAYLIYNAKCDDGNYQFGIGTYESAATEMVVETGASSGQGYTDIGNTCPREVSFAGVIGDEPSNDEQWAFIRESASDTLELSYQLYWRNYERITV